MGERDLSSSPQTPSRATPSRQPDITDISDDGTAPFVNAAPVDNSPALDYSDIDI